jgi:hypothetical protein
MSTAARLSPIDRAHLVGSVPLADCEQVFRRVADVLGPYVRRIPDGETGTRWRWVAFQRDMLLAHPSMELDPDVPPFRFIQWDGTLVREIPLIRFKAGVDEGAVEFDTGYDRAALESFETFEALRAQGVIPRHVRFQVSLPTPMAPGWLYLSPQSREAFMRAYERSLLGALARITAAIPPPDLAIQWDVCQEVLAWENYYEPGPVDFRTETLDVLAKIGDAVPGAIDLGYHLCYGSPADEHMVQPKDSGIMVEMVNAVSARVRRPIDFFHLPVPKGRTDDGYFAPLASLKLRPETELYLVLIHHNDAAGDAARLAAARRYARVDGIGTECGMARGDPARLPALLAAHVRAAEIAA